MARTDTTPPPISGASPAPDSGKTKVHPRSRPRRVLRWSVRIIGGLLALIVLVVGGALIYLHTNPGRAFLTEQVNAQIDATFVGGGHVGSIEGSPFGTLIAKDIVINDQNGSPAIKIARVDLKIDLAALVNKTADLESLTAQGVDVKIARAADGTFLRPTMHPGPESGWTVNLEKVEVHDAHVAFQAQQEGDLKWINADDLSVSARMLIPAHGPIAATLALRTVWRERGVPVVLHTSVRTGEGITEVPALHVMAGSVMVTGEKLRIATRNDGLLPRFSGIVTAVAPRLGVERLIPDIQLLDDVTAKVTLRDTAPWTHVGVEAALGTQWLTVFGAVDLDVRHGQGIAATGGVELGGWTNGSVTGVVNAFAAFDGFLVGADREKPRAVGVVHASGAVLNLPHAVLFATAVMDGEDLALRGNVASTAARGLVSADLKLGENIILSRGYLDATTSSPSLASGGRVPAKGAIHAVIQASGRLSPLMNLSVKGTIDGQRVRVQDISARSVKAAFELEGVPARPRGRAEVDIKSLVRGEMQLGELKVTAANQGGDIVVAVRSRPKLRPWMIDIDARIIPPKPRMQTWTVDINRHHVKAGANGEWKGTTGHLEIGPNHFAINNFSSTSTLGAITLSASVAPHHLEVQASVQRPDIGTAKIALDVDAPVAFTNPAAWARLDRKAIRSGEISVIGDLEKAAEMVGQGGKIAGTLTGKLVLTPTGTTGTFALVGVKMSALRGFGEINAALNITQPSPIDDVAVLLAGNLGGLGGFQAKANLAIPKRPFDPLAWRMLGPDAVHGAQIALDEVEIEPGLLERLGVTSELRGRVTVGAVIGDAMRSVRVTLDIKDLRGALIAQAIDAHVEVMIDNKMTTATTSVTSGKVTLLQGVVSVPLTMNQVASNPRLVLQAPIKGTITIPKAPAVELLAVFGRSEVQGGTLDGTIDFSGTLGAPSIKAKLTAENLKVPSRSRRPIQPLDKLVLDATFDGKTVVASITGKQPGGSLDLNAQFALNDMARGTATLKATRFDLAPVLAFAPGPTGAGRGVLDADLTVTGLDPMSARFKGKLHVERARFPLAPEVGTLNRATIDVVVGESAIDVKIEGKLGDGDVKLVGKVDVEGARPTGGKGDLTLRKVSPIGSVEPRIDANVALTLRKTTTQWIIDMDVSNGKIDVPDARGEPLKPTGPPSDMFYAVTGQKLDEGVTTKAPPRFATIIVNINIRPTYVKSTEVTGVVRGKLTISANADAIGIVGSIEADRGDLDLFGRRYQVERAVIRFDGSTDPLLDLRITYNFPEVTTITSVRGRLSKPQLVLSSDPAIYSQDQLLGFILGGEPNGDPTSGSARDVATSAGTSFVANAIGNRVKKWIPVDIDVIRYAAATGTESANVTVGTWITRSLFVAYRRRLEARPDENGNEADVQYYLTRRVMVEATTGDRAVSGIDLLWRKRY